MKKLLVLLLATASLSAAPVISTISPTSGPAAGGTTVTITGSGFEPCAICSPPLGPFVKFGGVEAPPVTILNDTTILVTAPPHLPGTVDLTFEQWNGTLTLPNAFTYTGTFEDSFERVLLPLFTPPVTGAFGSRFVTELRAANGASDTTAYAFAFGVQPLCARSGCRLAGDPWLQPLMVRPGSVVQPLEVLYDGNPGRFVYLPAPSSELAMNVRVYDSSRSAFNFGTEMPVVHDREFTTVPVKLLGVPLDARFRNTLRIYAKQATTVVVSYGTESHVVELTAGRDLFDPAYGVYSAFPVGTGFLDVTVAPFVSAPPMVPNQPDPIWAFVSVTNNDTQLITTITPQR